jgi:hypothetical protein
MWPWSLAPLPLRPELTPYRGASGRQWNDRDLDQMRDPNLASRELSDQHTPDCGICPSRLSEADCRIANELTSFGRHFASAKLQSKILVRHWQGVSGRLNVEADLHSEKPSKQELHTISTSIGSKQ